MIELGIFCRIWILEGKGRGRAGGRQPEVACQSRGVPNPCQRARDMGCPLVACYGGIHDEGQSGEGRVCVGGWGGQRRGGVLVRRGGGQ